VILSAARWKAIISNGELQNFDTHWRSRELLQKQP
jgi:hypothetical protein